jgi:hypothetical protein
MKTYFVIAFISSRYILITLQLIIIIRLNISQNIQTGNYFTNYYNRFENNNNSSLKHCKIGLKFSVIFYLSVTTPLFFLIIPPTAIATNATRDPYVWLPL